MAFFLSTISALAGAGLLYFAHPYPDTTIPVWQFGQWILFSSIIHLSVYLALFATIRKSRTDGDQPKSGQ